MKTTNNNHSKSYSHILFLVIMVFLMSGSISFFLTLIKVGFISDLISVWLKAWLIAFGIGIPSVFIASPLAKKIAEYIVSTK